tara:strand:+ start:2591 stop:2905 length:315 start_codon:yes stop_codon:yes gene_type:complete
MNISVHTFPMIATSTVDRLGALRAQIANLEKAEKALVDEIKAQGPGSYEGELFVANVAEVAGRESIDPVAMETKLRELGVDDRFFSRHIKITKASVRLTIKDRN